MQKELVAWSLSALDSRTIHDCLVSDIKTRIRQNHMAFPLMFTCMLMHDKSNLLYIPQSMIQANRNEKRKYLIAMDEKLRPFENKRKVVKWLIKNNNIMHESGF